MNPLRSIFKVVFVHEDPIAGAQAADLLKRLAARLETDLEDDLLWQTDNNVWKFEMLQSPEVLKQALATTVEADMIVISAGDTTELPVYVKKWIEDALLLKQGEPAALVALLGADMETSKPTSRTGAYLRQLAEQIGLDYFCNRSDPPQNIGSDISPSFSRFEDDSPLLDDAIPKNFYQRGWGINE